MHQENMAHWQHLHLFSNTNRQAERKTWIVVYLTFSMMIAEIVAGWLFNSMALLADGWHMCTHAAALGITAVAYWLARRYAHDQKFAFGTWKIEILGGFTSGILLGVVGATVAIVSLLRLFEPLVIRYDQAIAVAILGLIVNIASVALLRHDDGLGHHPDGDGQHQISEAHNHHSEAGHHGDLNLRAAYLHVLADSLTSVLAIAALLGGKFLGWNWLDPILGLVGALLILRWTFVILSATSNILLDREMDAPVTAEIREAIEIDGDSRISDLHVWRVAQDRFACIVAIIAHHPRPTEEYKARLRIHEELAHITVEIQQCPE